MILVPMVSFNPLLRDTLYAVVTAREILFTKPGPNIRVKDLHLDEFVQTTQSYVSSIL